MSNPSMSSSLIYEPDYSWSSCSTCSFSSSMYSNFGFFLCFPSWFKIWSSWAFSYDKRWDFIYKICYFLCIFLCRNLRIETIVYLFSTFDTMVVRCNLISCSSHMPIDKQWSYPWPNLMCCSNRVLIILRSSTTHFGDRFYNELRIIEGSF